MSRTVLRLTGRQHQELRRLLFPGDGKESVAFALCGRFDGSSHSSFDVAGAKRRGFCVHRIIPLCQDAYRERRADRVRWSTDSLVPVLAEAARKNMAVLKIHSHTADYAHFSDTDDRSDQDLFPSIASWTDSEEPHVSAIMLPDGRIIARQVSANGHFGVIDPVAIAGEKLSWLHASKTAPSETTSDFDRDRRLGQTFGAGTTKALKELSIGVVGASGTGSFTIEMLARLGVRELVIVDPDVIEHKNLGRIINAFARHADLGASKVDVLAGAIAQMGFGTDVVAIQRNLWDPDVVRRLAAVDVLFGCMDSVDGRDLLNRLAVYYCIPYFDIGVRIDADGRGGVEQICGTVHYLQPDGSSLASRGVYGADDVYAAVLRRTEPKAYAEQLRAKYIRGANEDRPAVISVNALYAALGVNEFLARLHDYRDDGNSCCAAFGISLTQARLIHENDGVPCPALSKRAGLGHTRPLLGVPALSAAATNGH